MRLYSVIASALWLAACGGAAPDNGQLELREPTDLDAAQSGVGMARNAQPAAPSQGTAAAEGIDCRNRQPGPGGANDVLGVSMGMDASEAYARLACANPAFTVEFTPSGGFSEIVAPPGAAPPRKLITANAGTDKAVVYLAGQPGQEKVYVVQRTLEFGEGKEPPVETLYQTMAAKYGKGIQHAPAGSPIVSVVHSPTGELMGTDSETLRQCVGNPRYTSISVSEACGLTAEYAIDPKASNTGLAARLYVTVADQRGAMQAIKAYKQGVDTAVQQQRADELRRAREATSKAGEDGTRLPTL